MAEFNVKVIRTSFSKATIKVEADSEEEAEKKALEVSGDHSYSEYDAEYDVEFIESIKK